MRTLTPVALLVGAWWAAVSPPAEARPEFARRESKACGYCHINPRGGGPRNQRGLDYAKNEYKFPTRVGTLASFPDKRKKQAFLRARKLLGIDHVPMAVDALRRLERSLKRAPEARKLVAEELHDLEVQASEVLGRARLLLRKRRDRDRAEGVSLLVLLKSEYKDLEVWQEAKDDLRDAKKEHPDAFKKEEHEAKARRALLDALAKGIDGQADKERAALAKVVEKYEGTRAAGEAAKRLAGEE